MTSTKGSVAAESPKQSPAPIEAALAEYERAPSRGNLAKLTLSLYEAGRYEEALRHLDAADAGQSKYFLLVNLRGVLLRRLQRHQEALAAFRDAAKLDRKAAGPHLNAGNVYLDLNEPDKAIAPLTQAVQRDPRSGFAQRMLGRAYRICGELEQARRRLELARQLTPTDPETWTELADTLALCGNTPAALDLLDKAIAQFGQRKDILLQRVAILRRAGRVQDAITWLSTLIQATPDDAWLHYQLGLTLSRVDWKVALDSFRRAAELAPDDPDILTQLADALDRLRGPTEADNIAEAYEVAVRRLKLGGNLLRSAHELIRVLVRCADYEAIAQIGTFDAVGRYFAINQNVAGLHTLIPRVETAADRRSLVDLHRGWGRIMATSAARSPISHPPALRSARVKIGFMSSDLRDHPVSYFAAPLLLNLDRSRFEIFCYSWTNRTPDAVQRRIASAVDRFVHDSSLSDRDAAQLIAADGLDLLFELGGSTDQNKIRTMAWRPAPRQASWLGYPHSAGLETIDRILTDPYITPPDPTLLIERPLELAHSWVAFERPGFGDLPGIDPDPPQARNGFVTFGTFNNPQKYGPAVIKAWARILAAVPGSRFLFVRPEGAVAPFRANIEKRFAAHGIAADRIGYIPVRGTHLKHYNALDISLDTFPQTGGTTTCESLYMGVPVVTLVGEAFFERLSYSNLSNAGLGEYCAWTVEDYVQKAVELASAREWRTMFRRTIGERLRSHPLGRVEDFAADFSEAVLRWMDEQPR